MPYCLYCTLHVWLKTFNARNVLNYNVDMIHFTNSLRK